MKFVKKLNNSRNFKNSGSLVSSRDGLGSCSNLASMSIANGTSKDKKIAKKLCLLGDGRYKSIMRYYSYLDCASVFFSFEETSIIYLRFNPASKQSKAANELDVRRRNQPGSAAGNTKKRAPSINELANNFSCSNQGVCLCAEKIVLNLNLNNSSISSYGFVYCSADYVNENCDIICWPSSSLYYNQGYYVYFHQKNQLPNKKFIYSSHNNKFFNLPVFKDSVVADQLDPGQPAALNETNKDSLVESSMGSAHTSKIGIMGNFGSITGKDVVSKKLDNFCNFSLQAPNPQYINYFELYMIEPPKRSFGSKVSVTTMLESGRMPLSRHTSIDVGSNVFDFSSEVFRANVTGNILDFDCSFSKNSRHVKNPFIMHEFDSDMYKFTRPFQFENIDYGCHTYRNLFNGGDHSNYIVNDVNNFGPIIISVSQKISKHSYNWGNAKDNFNNQSQVFADEVMKIDESKSGTIQNCYHIILRTVYPIPLRICVHESIVSFESLCNNALAESVNNNSPVNNADSVAMLDENNTAGAAPNPANSTNAQRVYSEIKMLLNFFPQIDARNLSKLNSNAQIRDELIKLDEMQYRVQYKIGVLYCGPHQSTEEEMYNNKEGSPNFDRFLRVLGTRVRLSELPDKVPGAFTGQLDTTRGMTGEESVYTVFQNREIMFHVSTMLPFSTENTQQLDRKRHIGNDIVTVIFQESNSGLIDPGNFRSHFQHVFIIVKQVNDEVSDEEVRYTISVSRKSDVPYFGPVIDRLYKFNAYTRNFLLTKIINAENASFSASQFISINSKTRYEFMKHIVEKFEAQSQNISHIINKKEMKIVKSAARFNLLELTSANTIALDSSKNHILSPRDFKIGSSSLKYLPNGMILNQNAMSRLSPEATSAGEKQQVKTNYSVQTSVTRTSRKLTLTGSTSSPFYPQVANININESNEVGNQSDPFGRTSTNAANSGKGQNSNSTTNINNININNVEEECQRKQLESTGTLPRGSLSVTTGKSYRPKFDFTSPETTSKYGVVWQVDFCAFNDAKNEYKECLMLISEKTISFINDREILLTIVFEQLQFYKSSGPAKVDFYYRPNNMVSVRLLPPDNMELPYIMCRLKFLWPHNRPVKTIRLYNKEHNQNNKTKLVVDSFGVVSFINEKCEAYEKGVRRNTQLIEVNKIPLLKMTYKRFLRELNFPYNSQEILLTFLVDNEESNFKDLNSSVNSSMEKAAERSAVKWATHSNNSGGSENNLRRSSIEAQPTGANNVSANYLGLKSFKDARNDASGSSTSGGPGRKPMLFSFNSFRRKKNSSNSSSGDVYCRPPRRPQEHPEDHQQRQQHNSQTGNEAFVSIGEKYEDDHVRTGFSEVDYEFSKLQNQIDNLNLMSQSMQNSPEDQPRSLSRGAMPKRPPPLKSTEHSSMMRTEKCRPPKPRKESLNVDSTRFNNTATRR